MAFDCQTCGACCCNPDENRAEGWPYYVEVEDTCRLLRKKDLAKRYVVSDPEGKLHLRLEPTQRCSALKGTLGKKVQCQIYSLRPLGCKRVEPMDEACLTARRERGLCVTP